jgi:hypothetical protein
LYILCIYILGTLNGHIKIDDGAGHKFVKEYSFDTFRDHSWDIRNWAAMDSLFILLIHFDEPIVIDNTKYEYFDLTLVDMPGNVNGVQSFTTGYFSSTDASTKNLPILHATSIRELPYQMSKIYKNESGNPTREPSSAKDYVVDIHVGKQTMIQLNINHANVDLSRRVMYFPDDGNFHCFEDNITQVMVDGIKNGYGTRQIGYRACESVDLSEGGVG